MNHRKRSWIWAIVSVAVIAVAIALLAHGKGSGPDRHEAHADPVFAKIERRALTETLNLPATFQFSDPITVTAPGAGDTGGTQIVTTSPPSAGTRVAAGSAVVWVNYRPILVLQMALPLYRDIHPGDSGQDVSALQNGLRALGYAIPASETGTFGWSSQQAVTKLYEANGAEPDYTQGTLEQTNAVIQDARQAAETARQQANAARAQGQGSAELDQAYRQAAAKAEQTEHTEGVLVTAADIVSIPKKSAKIGTVDVAAGERIAAGQSLLTLTGGPVIASASVTAEQLSGLRPDSKVQVVGVTGRCAMGKPTAAPPATADTPSSGTDGATDSTNTDGGDGAQGEASPPANGNDGALAGGSGLDSDGDLTVPVTCSPGPAISLVGNDTTVTVSTVIAPADSLVVPATAIVYTTDNHAQVALYRAGKIIRVPVSAHAEANGYVVITARSASIRPGASVLVTD